MKKTQELINQIEITKKLLLLQNTDLSWSGYDNVEDVITDLEHIIFGLFNDDCSVLKDLKIMFAPTGCIQEISIDSGWADEYIEIASKIDSLI